MKEWVFLPLQKYKELVDYTKRSNDIITGFVKSKNATNVTEERKAAGVKKRSKTASKTVAKSKKRKRSEEERPPTPEEPPTPEQSSASDSEESSAF